MLSSTSASMSCLPPKKRNPKPSKTTCPNRCNRTRASIHCSGPSSFSAWRPWAARPGNDRLQTVVNIIGCYKKLLKHRWNIKMPQMMAPNKKTTGIHPRSPNPAVSHQGTPAETPPSPGGVSAIWAASWWWFPTKSLGNTIKGYQRIPKAEKICSHFHEFFMFSG